MKFTDLAAETWEGLDANRGRSLLTVLGIVIGISAVIAMTALIGGVKQGLMGQLGLSQARMVYMNVYGSQQMTQDDLPKIQEGLDDYESVTGLVYGQGTATSDKQSVDAQVMGVEPVYFSIAGMKLVSGRTFSTSESKAGATVVMLDEAGAHQLFGDATDVAGRKIRINGIEYTVAGVLQSTQNLGNTVVMYAPLKTVTTRIAGRAMLDQAIGIAKEGTDMDALVQKTTSWLASYYNIPSDEIENSVYVQSMKTYVDQLNSYMATFQLLMTAVASISLLVGGIGIMNMMLTNVTERIREIGLRKALGARSSDITKQFLLESITLTLAGGVIGMVVGYLGAYALSGLASNLLNQGSGSMTITPAIEPEAVAVATGICVLIGVIFGYYPARRAAKLDPVESLHYQ
ncbi:MAG: ABC transporter permease [Coriobacteriales bacterium]|nr:ABC transporter permease [Coriobacteriales bacterium]